MSKIYIKELNDFCRKFILRGEHKITREDVILYPNRLKNIKSIVFESLLLFEKTTFKVYGENVPLAFLINELSVKGLEQLIDQNGLEFALWTPMIGRMESNIPGMIPLIHGRVSSGAHCDPEESIETGLRCLSRPPNKKQRETIKRKVRDLYIFPEEGIERDSVYFALSAYRSNKLNSFGLSIETSDISNLTTKQKQILEKCASDLTEYKFIMSENLIFPSESNFSKLYNDSFRKIYKSNHTDIVSHVANLENFPNLREVAANLERPLQNIHKIRDKNSVKKFRRWVNEVASNKDMNEVSKAYIDSIVNSKGFFETKTGRFTKNVAMTMIGAGIGSFAGSAGAVVGGTVGRLIEPVVDFALDMVDEYLISELTKGWVPRVFFDELEKLKQPLERK